MEIKILGICGSPIKNGNTQVFLEAALKAAAEIEGVSTELITLAGKSINDCIHCNWCVVKQEEGKVCSQNDDMSAIFPKVMEADGILVATPVYCCRLSGPSAAFLDRLRACVHGKFYRNVLTNKVGGALAVGWGRNAGLETALQSILVAYSTYRVISPSPGLGSSCPWGAAGLSSDGGTGVFDPKDRLGVLKDEFGMNSARAMGKRVTDVARIMKAGQSALANE